MNIADAMKDCYRRETCRLCEGRNLQLVISLAPTPPGNHFVAADKLHVEQKRYPLDVYFCDDCKHLQLGHVVDPRILYQEHYSYVSATSPVFVAHLRDYAHDIGRQYDLTAGGLIIDIGSNDGTALSFFKEQGYRVFGIDPAIEIAERANASGIETLCELFSLEVAEKYSAQYGRATLINSHNACAHIDDLASVVSGMKTWLADDGILVIEVGYLLDVYENVWFDTIYHEHLDFHSVRPLVPFFNRLGMQVIDVTRVSPQGGSIRVVAQKRGGRYEVKESVEQLIERERQAGIHEARSFVQYAERIQGVKEQLTTLVEAIKAQGKSIAGFGAPTKATTLLSHFNLEKAVDFLVDDNPLKQDLYSPGHHLPVHSADAIYQRQPDYLLILAWNFAQNIMQRHSRYQELGGRFILPLPVAMIVE